MADEETRVAVDRGEAEDLQAQLLGAALGVVQVGDRRAVRAQDAQRGVHRVAVLRVLDGDQRTVVREVADAGRLAVPVDQRGLVTGAGEVDRRTVLVRGAAHHRRSAVAGQGHPCRIGRFEARYRRFVGAALEGLAAPDAELVAVLVVEPPDPLPVRGEHTVRRAVRPVRDLALLARRTVPGVQLIRPRRVRHEQGTVGCVLRPVGQGHAGRPEALLPVRCVLGPVALSHGPILPAHDDIALAGSSACG